MERIRRDGGESLVGQFIELSSQKLLISFSPVVCGEEPKKCSVLTPFSITRCLSIVML